MTTLGTVLALVALGLAFAAYFVARAIWHALGRIVRSAERQLGRRLVDIVLLWLGLDFLARRSRRRGARWARPASVARPPALEGDEIYRACPLTPWTGDPRACRWCNRLLPARCRRWCPAPATCQAEAQANHEWGPASAGARQRDGNRCRWTGCGAVATFDQALEVHHIHAVHGRHGTPGCHHHLDGLVTLCRAHHLEVTAGQRAAGEFDSAPHRSWRIAP